MAVLLSSCLPGVTTLGACNVHKETFCQVDVLGNFKDGETWKSCKWKRRLSQATVDTIPRFEKNQFAAYKTWIVEHCTK